jgi:hypothetical protein
MKWFKVQVNKTEESTYHYVGASADTLDVLTEKVQRGEFVRLRELLYVDNRGDIKPWDPVDALATLVAESRTVFERHLP